MKFFSSLATTFSPSLLEQEYKKIQQTHTRNFFKILLLKFAFTCLFLLIYCLIQGRDDDIGPIAGILAFCCLCWVFSHKLHQYREPLVLIFGLAFTIGAFFYIRRELVPSDYYSALT